VVEEFELATSGSAGVELVVIELAIMIVELVIIELVVMIINVAIAIISPVATVIKLNVAKVDLVMPPVEISAIAVVVTVAIGGTRYVSRRPRREGTLSVARLGGVMDRVAWPVCAEATIECPIRLGRVLGAAGIRAATHSG